MKVYASYSKEDEDKKKSELLLNALDVCGIEWKNNGINDSVFSGDAFSHILILLTESYQKTNDYRKYWNDVKISDKSLIIVLGDDSEQINMSLKGIAQRKILRANLDEQSLKQAFNKRFFSSNETNNNSSINELIEYMGMETNNYTWQSLVLEYFPDQNKTEYRLFIPNIEKAFDDDEEGKVLYCNCIAELKRKYIINGKLELITPGNCKEAFFRNKCGRAITITSTDGMLTMVGYEVEKRNDYDTFDRKKCVDLIQQYDDAFHLLIETITTKVQ